MMWDLRGSEQTPRGGGHAFPSPAPSHHGSMAIPIPAPNSSTASTFGGGGNDYLGVPSAHNSFQSRSAPSVGGFSMPSPHLAPSGPPSPGYVTPIPSPMPSPQPYEPRERAVSSSGSHYAPQYIKVHEVHHHSHSSSHRHHKSDKDKKHKKHSSHSRPIVVVQGQPSQPVQVAYTHSAPRPSHKQSHSAQYVHPTGGGGGYVGHQPQVAHPNKFLLPPQKPHPQFQYSKCTGRKRALCIGINYIGTKHALRGCINDAKHTRDALIGHFGYRREDIVVLSDDASNPRSIPTRRNIIDAFRWLVQGAQPNDSLFLHYSGHGGQTKDKDGDEVDGWDEVIYPLDYKTAGHIVDDEMHAILVKPLPAGCRLTALFDSCHSGTVLDLPYIYSSSGRQRGSHVSNRARARKSTPADVISWSGCKDGQTSADTFAGGVAVGAMSWAFISALRRNKHQTYQQLLTSIRELLYERYTQKPQLGSSHHIDTNLPFLM